MSSHTKLQRTMDNSQKFKEKDVLIQDFILLSYSVPSKSAACDLVGCTSDRKCIVVYRKSESDDTYNILFKKKTGGGSVFMVSAFDYDSSGNMSYLVSLNDDQLGSEGYQNIIYSNRHDPNKEENMSPGSVITIGDTVAVPFLFAFNYKRPALLLQRDIDGQLTTLVYESFTFSGKGKKETVYRKGLERLNRLHTSGFIDIRANASPKLVLDVGTGRERKIRVLGFSEKDVFRQIAEIQLSADDIGPLAFADFNGSGYADVAYVSKVGNGFYINIIFNIKERCETDDEEKAKEKKDKKNKTTEGAVTKSLCMDLGQIVPADYEPMLCNEIGVPSGIFAADFLGNTTSHIILTIKHKTDGRCSFVLIKNDGKGKLALSGIVSKDAHQVLSATFSDVLDTGKEHLLLNSVGSDKTYSLRMYSNGLMSDSTYYFSLIAYRSVTSDEGTVELFKSPVPGVSYHYTLVERGVKDIGYQMIQSTFPHLKQPRVLFYIGDLPYLIDLEKIGYPNLHEHKTQYNIIVPNSRMFISNRDNTIVVSQELNSGVEIKYIWYAILGVSTVLIFILIGFFIRYKRREGVIRKKEKNLFNFFKTL